MIDFKNLNNLESLHIKTKSLDFWNYSKIAKQFKVTIDLSVKSSDDSKKNPRKKLQKILETIIVDFHKSEKTKDNILDCQNYLSHFAKLYTNFDNCKDLLNNSDLQVITKAYVKDVLLLTNDIKK